MKKELVFIQENWIPIQNYENSYEISNLGNIRSLDRYLLRKDGRKYLKKGKYLNPGKNTKGYYQVRLEGGNIYRVHRLVALAFIPNPLNLPQVNHKNGIKTDNRAENLEWCTNSQNQLHAYNNGLQKDRSGENNSRAKLNNLLVVEIRDLYKSGHEINDICDKFSESRQTIRNVIFGKTWKHIEGILN